jgi:phenylalanyl-tRNA synthetase beta chain
MAGSLLETVAYNLNRKNRNNRLFEIGKTFRPDPQTGLADERDILAITIEGSCFPQSWGNQELPNDFFALKGILEAFVTHCALGAMSFARMETNDGLIYGSERATIKISNNNIGIDNQPTDICGTIGRISDQICKSFGIKSTVFYAELDLTEWLSTPKPLPKYNPLPKFPALERDFCFVMPETLSSDAVTNEIKGISELIRNVRPFDVYRGEKLAAGTKSVAFAVEFRSAEKTLTDEDVAEACAKIISVMEKRHGAELRK